MYRSIIRITVLALGVAVLAIGAWHARDARANNIATSQTVFSTNMASAGFGGMRGIGTGTITLSGVSGSVSKALLYWQGPTNSTDPTVNAAVTFAGTPITGTNIGFSNDNCWGFANSQGYRADVTSLVAGNGVYSLANFTKGTADINGASLIVFFDDGNSANNRDVVIFDGNDSNISNIYDADGWNATLSGINYTSGAANIVLHVSDGQTFTDAALILNGTTTLASAGSVFDGNTVPNGAGGPSNGGLWDIRSFDVTPALSPGPNTLSLTTGVSVDCLSLIVAAIDLPAGAAPTPTPGTPVSPTATFTPGPTSTPCPLLICHPPTPNNAVGGVTDFPASSGGGGSYSMMILLASVAAVAVSGGAAATYARKRWLR